jgi:cyclase
VVPVQANVYMLVGAGGNMTVQVGKDGVMVVDAKSAAAAPAVMAAIRTLSDKPIIWMVNTHLHADHTAGNEALLKLGGTDPVQRPRVIAHENVLNRLANPAPGAQPRIAEAATVNDTYFGPYKDFYFNGEPIFVYYMPNAHTDGDSMVLFRRSDVLATGDIFTPERYPILDLANGGGIQGEIDALNKILELTVPARYQEGGTYVVPGHGRLCDEADVVEYRDMATIIRDRIRDLIGKGMTLDQVKAAKPTQDYDTRYGATTGIWTTDMFVEAVYNSLKGATR